HQSQITNHLHPLSRLLQLLDLVLDQVPLERADVGDEELAIQMIGLVQKRARQQRLACHLKKFAVKILRSDGDFVGASYALAELRDAEAAFAAALPAFGLDDLRIYKDELGAVIFLEAGVDHR